QARGAPAAGDHAPSRLRWMVHGAFLPRIHLIVWGFCARPSHASCPDAGTVFLLRALAAGNVARRNVERQVRLLAQAARRSATGKRVSSRLSPQKRADHAWSVGTGDPAAGTGRVAEGACPPSRCNLIHSAAGRLSSPV